MRRALGAGLLILSLLMLFGSCQPTGPVTSIGSQGFLPGEVLSDLPVYPGASPTTLLNTGSGPPSFPLSSPVYAGPSRPGYQSA